MTQTRTVAQALVAFFDQQWVSVDGKEEKFVKGYMGIFGHGNVLGLGQALEENKKEIPFIQGKNEQEIAHTCMAYAKQKRRKSIYGCTASIGPGSMNLVTAAANATVNRIPLLLLPADSYADRQPDPVLQQLECESNYSLSVNDAFKPVSKYWDRIIRPEQLMSACLNAMRVLTDSAQTGAVTLSLPQDVQGESYAFPDTFFEKRVWVIDRTPPTQDAIQRAVEIIKNSKRPLIISGGGVRYSDAGDAVGSFARAFGIPIAETQAGKGETSCDESLYVGCAGVCGSFSANHLAKESDCIIAIGTKLNDFVTNSKAGFSSAAAMVSINISRMDSIKWDAQPIVADARAGVEALEKELYKTGYRSAYKNEITNAKQTWKTICDDLRNGDDSEGMSQTRVLLALNQQLAHEDVIIAASGSLPSDVERIWDVRQRDTYHLEYGFSCMGYEIPGALGVKYAQPEREVFALLGDGGFLMSHAELVTSLQENKKINILLFNNHGHQCIHNLQRSKNIDTFGTVFRYRDEENGLHSGDYLDIDFLKIAEGYGLKAWKVTTMDELHQAIDACKKEKTSTLIEICVLPGTMTEGYENFWRVGTASVAKNPAVVQAYQEMQEVVNKLRKY